MLNSLLLILYLAFICSFVLLACGCVPFAMERAHQQPNRWRRLRDAVSHLFEADPTNRCHFVWRLVSVALIIFGCIIIASITWSYTLYTWPRQEQQFYENLNKHRRGTSTTTELTANTDEAPCPSRPTPKSQSS